jgi:two-component sensor histidine kinase
MISLRLFVAEENLVIELADNGKGMGNALQEKSKEGRGSGLVLIEGLLTQIKSEWKWTSRKGTLLSIKIPLSVKVLHP